LGGCPIPTASRNERWSAAMSDPKFVRLYMIAWLTSQQTTSEKFFTVIDPHSTMISPGRQATSPTFQGINKDHKYL